MERQISTGLKYTFLVHFIVGLVFGLIFLFIPEQWGDLINWPVEEPPVYRLLGAAVLGYAASSWLAYRETAWERVEIVVQMEIVWTILGTLVMLWGMIFSDLPTFGWVDTVALGASAVAFSYFFFREWVGEKGQSESA